VLRIARNGRLAVLLGHEIAQWPVSFEGELSIAKLVEFDLTNPDKFAALADEIHIWWSCTIRQGHTRDRDIPRTCLGPGNLAFSEAWNHRTEQSGLRSAPARTGHEGRG